MPETIPYSPQLALGNIIAPDVMKSLEQIAQANAPADDAQTELNRMLSLLRSLQMTASELAQAGVPASKELNETITEVGTQISGAATNYASKASDAAKALVSIGTPPTVSEHYESPIDYVRTQIKQMPLSADSLQMNAQYFSYDYEMQSSQQHIDNVKASVGASVSVLGDTFASQVTTAVQKQMSTSMDLHEIQGTLVVSATTTQKDALLLAPCVLDVDKAILVWNAMGLKPELKPDDPSQLGKLADSQPKQGDAQMKIISGATYGSSFVALVNIERTSSTASSQSLTSVAASLQTSMEVGSWFESVKGGFGIDSSFSNAARDLLSTQQITSHASVVCMGVIPSIVANDVQVGVQQFADFDPAKMMGELATLANATQADQSSVAEAATRARTGAQMQSIRNNEITSVVSGLATMDDGKNKIIDINTAMTAFEDYVNKCIGGKAGIPITYYIKPITAVELAKMWVAKYFPKKYIEQPTKPGGGGTGGGGTDGGGTGGGGTPDEAPANNDSGQAGQ